MAERFVSTLDGLKWLAKITASYDKQHLR